jgi:hypothetical protein
LVLRVVWGGRVDPVEEQVDMVWDMMGRFARLGGLLARPWYALSRKPYVVSESKDELRRWFAQAARADHYRGPGLTQATGFVRDAPPFLWGSTDLISPRGGPRMAANSVVLLAECGENMRESDPLPVGWLLGLGRRIVLDCVEVWRPDAVSLDTTELVLVNPARASSFPVAGFCSWFSDSVVDRSVGLPDAPVKERHRGGTLLGIDPDSPDPLADALALAARVYGSGALRLVPYVQGEPGPTLDQVAGLIPRPN